MENKLLISHLEVGVEKGYIRKVTEGELSLYNYTDALTYAREWDEYNMQARGIIFDTGGNIVARPFPKFFNLGEHESTFLHNLPKEPYAIWEKLDGSLGIIYYYRGKWNVATRGSFSSDQAREAKKMLDTMYDWDGLNRTCTYLVEIIYPENRIVVDYGKERKLVLLAARHTRTGEYVSDMELTETAMDVCMEQAAQYNINMTIEDCIAAQKTLPKDKEGFVVEFLNGLRVKIKGNEYMKIAKIMAHMTPLAFWEVMENGKVPESYLQQIPEEFRPEWEPIVNALETAWLECYENVLCDINNMERTVDSTDMRAVGIYMRDNPGRFQYPQLTWPVLRKNKEAQDKAIMSIIRPKGNVL